MSDETQRLIDALQRVRAKPIESPNDVEIRKAEVTSLFSRIYGADSPQEKQLARIQYHRHVGSGWVGPGGSRGGFAVTQNFAECRDRVYGVINSAIDELESLGLPDKPKAMGRGLSLHVNQTQTVNLSVVLESIQDSLTPEQAGELREILSSPGEREEKQQKLSDKIKSFGQGVASNVLANLLTNPQVISAF